MCVTGHFDTGATRTSIDSRLASKLGLSPIGFTTSNTAAGPQGTPDYAIDMSFMSNLRPFLDLRVGSCNLPFDLNEAQSSSDFKKPLNPQNIGLLIGRDIMAFWNITWNGPTSTVFVSD